MVAESSERDIGNYEYVENCEVTQYMNYVCTTQNNQSFTYIWKYCMLTPLVSVHNIQLFSKFYVFYIHNI